VVVFGQCCCAYVPPQRVTGVAGSGARPGLGISRNGAVGIIGRVRFSERLRRANLDGRYRRERYLCAWGVGTLPEVLLPARASGRRGTRLNRCEALLALNAQLINGCILGSERYDRLPHGLGGAEARGKLSDLRRHPVPSGNYYSDIQAPEQRQYTTTG
jgi:hypothetical protein